MSPLTLVDDRPPVIDVGQFNSPSKPPFSWRNCSHVWHSSKFSVLSISHIFRKSSVRPYTVSSSPSLAPAWLPASPFVQQSAEQTFCLLLSAVKVRRTRTTVTTPASAATTKLLLDAWRHAPPVMRNDFMLIATTNYVLSTVYCATPGGGALFNNR